MELPVSQRGRIPAGRGKPPPRKFTPARGYVRDRGPKYDPRTSNLPLQRACGGVRLSAVEALLRDNADVSLVNCPDNSGVFPIHAVVITQKDDYLPAEGRLRIVCVLEKARCDLNAVTIDSNGYTALHLAVKDENTDMVDLLLSLGVDINRPDSEGNTPLHVSCAGESKPHKKYKAKMTEQLLKAGAAPNIKNIYGETALFVAAIRHADKVCCLLDYAADPSVINNLGQTALFRGHIRQFPAIEGDSAEVIEILANLCSIETEDVNGETAIFSAIRHQCPGDVKKLLDKGANINHRDRFGATPLHVSTECSSNILTELLIERQADCSIPDDYGADALHWAAWNANKHIVKTLLGTGKFTENKQDHFKNDYVTLASWGLKGDVLDIIIQVPTFTTSPTTEMNIWPNKLPLVDLYDNGYIDVSSLQDVSLPPILSLLDTPGLGHLTPYPEVDDVRWAVTTLMDRISEKIGELNSLFKCSITPSGSSNEGTKCELPNEFDFLFCLAHFANHCAPSECSKSGYATLHLKQNLPGDIKEKYNQFTKPGEDVSLTSKVFSCFAQIMKTALHSKEMWDEPRVPLILQSYHPKDPHLVITLFYRGKIFKNMEISIDMVPAIHLKEWQPSKLINHSILVPEDVYNNGFYLVLKGSNKDSTIDNVVFQISFVKLESYIIKTVPMDEECIYFSEIDEKWTCVSSCKSCTLFTHHFSSRNGKAGFS